MKDDFYLAKNYDFKVPKELIAHRPFRPRDRSRLLVVERKNKKMADKVFTDIVSFFQKGDCLVLNNTKVFKARLLGKKESGGRVEVLLVKKLKQGLWECLLKPAQRIKVPSKILFKANYYGQVEEKTRSGLFCLKFFPAKVETLLKQFGRVPLPPYIKEESKLIDYQTVYAKEDGAIAAPTAGLHFTKELIERIKNKGVEVIDVTLHCSLGTFRPIKSENIKDHAMAKEYLELSSEAADLINKTKQNKKRIFATGTTVARSLESAAVDFGKVKSFSGLTGLYIVPGYKFKVVDALITNFHTPLSTNLVLVASFSSLKLIKDAYSYGQMNKFRFFSFGDAMLII